MTLRYCVRCDLPIKPGEPYDTHLHHGATLAGCTNYSHQTCTGPRWTPPQATTALPEQSSRDLA